MFISIIIPTHNKGEYVKCVLTYLQQQTFLDNVEVILVIDGSDDGTLEFAKNARFKYQFKYQYIDNSGAATARNRGIEMATGEYILFLDDDVLPNPDYLKVLREDICQYPNHAQVGNLYKINLDSVPSVFEEIEAKGSLRFESLKENIYQDPINEAIKVVFSKAGCDHKDLQPACWWGIIQGGGNICFPASAIKKIGGFDENFKTWGPEDIDLFYRAFINRYDMIFNRHNLIYHLDHSRNHKGIANTMTKNATMLVKKYNKPKELLAYIGFFNGNISLQEFNDVCSEQYSYPKIAIDEFYVDLRQYILKEQVINWKKNDLN